MSAAAQCYKATLSVTTGLSAPFNNLAIIYKQQVLSYFPFLQIFFPHSLYDPILSFVIRHCGSIVMKDTDMLITP